MLRTIPELNKFMHENFPQGVEFGSLEEVGDGWVLMRLSVADSHLRPGGTVSGPTMMGMADVAIWTALQTKIGPSPLTVTSNLNINFLAKPQPVDMLARARVLRVGKRSGVGECWIYSGSEELMVAHVTANYSIPSR